MQVSIVSVKFEKLSPFSNTSPTGILINKLEQKNSDIINELDQLKVRLAREETSGVTELVQSSVINSRLMLNKIRLLKSLQDEKKTNLTPVNILQQLDQALFDLGLLADQGYPLQIVKRTEKLNIYIDDSSLKNLLSTILLSQKVHTPRAASTTVFLDRDHTDRSLTVTSNTTVRRNQKELTCDQEWQQLAHDWAEFTILRYKPGLKLETKQEAFYSNKQKEINATFLVWLTERYSFLAGRQLPTPHHLYHVPSYLAYSMSKGTIDKVALLVMDGMALADWKTIHNVWRRRHQDWKFNDKLLLAQIPTITAVSRQALISGLRPMDFAGSLIDTRKEPKLWESFWEKQKVAETDIVYNRLPKNIGNSHPHWIDKPRLQVICMVKSNLDDMIHSALHGNRGFFSDLELWLEGDSNKLEEILDKLLEKGFTIYLTSDHGHVEATGFGKITDEGLTVETRSKRARVYTDYNFASLNQEKYSQSFLWHGDNLLPRDTWALMPKKNHAFIAENEIVVAHGGAAIEEVVVPFVKIEKTHE